MDYYKDELLLLNMTLHKYKSAFLVNLIKNACFSEPDETLKE